MQHRGWVYWLVAVVVVAAAGLAVALADEARREHRVEITLDGLHEALALEDLADGEERSFTSGDHEVTVTRRGDRLEVVLDGERVVVPGGAGHLVLGDSMTWFGAGDGEREAEDGFRYVFVSRAEPDGEADERVEVRVDEKIFASAGGGERVHVLGPREGLSGFWVGRDSAAFQCPEDGTTLRVDPERVTEAGFSCPVCGRAMVRVEDARVKIIEITKGGADVEDD